MSSTSPLVAFGLYAMAIKQDSTPTCPDLQPFSKITDLKTGNVTTKSYATFEPDFWLLDGNYKIKPADNLTHVGLMSLSMSNAYGLFDIPPVLTVLFGTAHSSEGLTLKFAQQSTDYANSILVSYYNASDVLICSDAYNPTGWEFSTNLAVSNFQKIVITFTSTNKPYRYLRLLEIEFGKLIYFTGSDIKSASVVEEINPLSIELPIDTLELRLYSSDSAFSIISPSGDYAQLRDKQPLDVYETLQSDTVFIGQFYLDYWENPSDTEIIFKCIDMTGVLDTIPYMGGIWLTATTVGALLQSMFEAISTPYDLDPDLEAAEIKGWIPVCSYREALQQIAFMAGAYVTCSRSGIIRIYKTVLASELSSYDVQITKSDKGTEQSLTLKTLVTGVEVTAHNYVSNTSSAELYNGILPVGTHTITFNAPMHDLSITGATLTTTGANYAIVSVASTGTVTLLGQGYTDTKQVLGVYDTTIDSSVKSNILSITDATLVTRDNLAAITQLVYDYYQQRYLQKVKLYSPTAEVGNSVLVDTLYSRQMAGVVEKLSIDLSGGFTAQAEIVGGIIPL
ncbi:MAG: hypothetical protein JZU60_02165 [Ilumatobacteraceae bacterium]|nr:hypothetical protein [Ilumatobacteraceae bacterium]